MEFINATTTLEFPEIIVDGKPLQVTEGIENGSLFIERILCNKITYGQVNSSRFECTLHNMEQLSNKKIIVKQTKSYKQDYSSTIQSQDYTLYTGYVKSCKRDSINESCKLVCYDALDKYADYDIAPFLNDFWSDKTYAKLSALLVALRQYLLDNLDIDMEYAPGLPPTFYDRVLSSIRLSKFDTIYTLRLWDMLSMIGSITATNVITSEQGNIRLMRLQRITSNYTIKEDNYAKSKSTFEDYKVQPASSVSVYKDNGELISYNPSTYDTNPYIIPNNIFVNYFDEYYVKDWLTGYYATMTASGAESSRFTHIPSDIQMIIPDLNIVMRNVGVKVQVENRGYIVITGYTLSGPQLTDQRIISCGTEFFDGTLQKYNTQYGQLSSLTTKLTKTQEQLDATVTSLVHDVLHINTTMFGSETGTELTQEFADDIVALLEDNAIKGTMIESLQGNKVIMSDERDLQTTLNKMQDEIDDNIQSYSYAYEPTLNNAPANTWTTDAERQKHIGDMFYNTDTGYAYRFIKDTTYRWILLQDTDVTLALETARAAQNTGNMIITNLANTFGQNLIPFPYLNSNGYTNNGVQYTYDSSGVIIANGMIGSDGNQTTFTLYSHSTGNPLILSPGDYILSGVPNPIDITSSGRIVISFIDGTASIIDNIRGGYYPFQLDEAKEINQIYFRWYVSGTILDNITILPMLTQGTIPYIYQPGRQSFNGLQTQLDNVANLIDIDRLITRINTKGGLQVNDMPLIGRVQYTSDKYTVEKYSDGVMRMHYRNTFTGLSIATASGSIYVGNIAFENFPENFKDVPTVVYSTNDGGGNAWIWGRTATTISNPGGAYLGRGRSASDYTVTVEFIAEGYWK